MSNEMSEQTEREVPQEKPAASEANNELPWYFQVPPIIELAERTFWRDLPQLLKDHYGKWVCYHGDQIIGFADSSFDLCDECARRGIPERDYFLEYVIEQSDEIDPAEFLGR